MDSSTTYDLIGSPGERLTLWLYRDVTNSREIQERIVAGTLQPELAFINAKMVPDVLVLKAAAQKAFFANLRGTLRSRSMHAELVFFVAGSKHVGEALKRFGISDSGKGSGTASSAVTDIIVASIHKGAPDEEHVDALVQGTAHPLSSLADVTDPAAIKAVYKITEPELQIGSLADAVLCRIAASHC
ncbi:g8452 [Coccomyxa viridis]|uniref:G8452 protein n=1 Tax=Coccomyxa viridis TaxID=1274662 RepID=A0ABP1G0E4_9CHLO